MKIAVVHDELMRRGGAEQVVLTLLKAYPNADIFTLCYKPELTYPEFKKYTVKTSFFQTVARNVKLMHKLYFPMAIFAMKALEVKGYDIVIISSTHCAKYVKIDDRSVVFIYTYTPFRLAWDPSSYTQYNNSKGLYRWVFNKVIGVLQKIDAKAAKRGDYFLAMTQETAERIRKAYHVKDIEIIKPSVKSDNFYVSDKPKEYFLLVSRLEFYKKVDLAIEAFNKTGHKLIIVGNGTKLTELTNLAKGNIEFKRGLSSSELADMYANCRALIFPQHEDYGITPLEANASGRPVIAYGAGGIIDTMIAYTNDASEATAVFFKEQTVESLISAIDIFENLSFDSSFIRQHAVCFNDNVFVDKIKHFIAEKLKDRHIDVDTL